MGLSRLHMADPVSFLPYMGWLSLKKDCKCMLTTPLFCKITFRIFALRPDWATTPQRRCTA